jgi:hypothetical protein
MDTLLILAYSTYQLQPLDVSLFVLLSITYTNELDHL